MLCLSSSIVDSISSPTINVTLFGLIPSLGVEKCCSLGNIVFSSCARLDPLGETIHAIINFVSGVISKY